MLLSCATVFLSAFLLFQVQPLIGKFILPWFGSSPGVWATCMLFFQLLLLGGYAYAHFVVSRLSARRQGQVHLCLLGLALIALPITPAETWKPDSGDAPIGRILLVLLASVGAPFLILSSTGPLLQAWFARLHPDRSPYRLYALSNAGSLLALISYVPACNVFFGTAPLAPWQLALSLPFAALILLGDELRRYFVRHENPFVLKWLTW